MVIYQSNPITADRAVMMDGYGKIAGYIGPLRSTDNVVVYQDPVTGKYIPAADIYRFTSI